MSETVSYEIAKDAFQRFNTDESISSAHGILCGFSCVKPDISLDDWLGEVIVSIDLNNLAEKEAHSLLAEIFNNSLKQLTNPILNFSLLIADDNSSLHKQAATLREWCQGFLVGLGLSQVQTSDAEVLEMIKDINKIAQLDSDLMDNEDNAEDLFEIIEFVRIGMLFIQETLQPSKQDYIIPNVLH